MYQSWSLELFGNILIKSQLKRVKYGEIYLPLARGGNAQHLPFIFNSAIKPNGGGWRHINCFLFIHSNMGYFFSRREVRLTPPPSVVYLAYKPVYIFMYSKCYDCFL